MGVKFFVPGIPAPKGSRKGPNGRREANPRTKQWVEDVATVAMQYRSRAPEMPYRVNLTFQLPRPARPAYAWPSTLDKDKLERAVNDGLVKGGLLIDDRHIIDGRTRKVYGESGVWVEVETAVP